MLTQEELIEEIEQHAPAVRIRIVDEVLRDVLGADPKTEQAWLDEAERRWAAFKAGTSETVLYEDMMAKYGHTA